MEADKLRKPRLTRVVREELDKLLRSQLGALVGQEVPKRLEDCLEPPRVPEERGAEDDPGRS